MKRLFTLMIVAAVTIAATAQSLAFKCDGKLINNGETYCSTGINETYASLGWLYFEPKVHVVSATGGTVEVTAQSLDNKEIELCFGGTCVNGTNITKSSVLKPNEEVDIQLHANAQEAEKATYKVKLTAKCGAMVSTITLVMSNDPEVTSVEAIANSADGVIDIYTIGGNKVASFRVKADIDFPNLKKGTYIYKATVGGKTVCRKFTKK